MEVREGYKQTEIGVIPSDWEIINLSEAVDFLDGRRRPIKSGDREKIKGIYPYYGASGIIDYVNDYIFDEELILLGEDGENILSRNLPLAFKVNGKIWVNNHAHVLKPKEDFNITYLTNHLESLDYSLLNSGTAQPKLNKKNCEKILIKKPTLREQTAIATALSDTDAWINSLEQLLTKKRQIKQGAMQELLQPNPEASGGWEVKKLTEVVDYIHGKAHEQHIDKFGKYIVVNSKFVSTEGNVRKYSKMNFCPAKKDDLLTVLSDLPNGKALAKCYYVKENNKYAVNQRICIWRSKGANQKFLFYILNRMEYFLKLNDGVSQTHILNHHIEKCEISIPKSKAEQTRIATILSDMDEEIEQLENKLEKAKQLKQGMMQELLTGRIRLV